MALLMSMLTTHLYKRNLINNKVAFGLEWDMALKLRKRQIPSRINHVWKLNQAGTTLYLRAMHHTQSPAKAFRDQNSGAKDRPPPRLF